MSVWSGPADLPREPADVAGQSRATHLKLLAFLCVLAAVLAYGLWIDGSNDAVLRSFLRNLFRAVF